MPHLVSLFPYHPIIMFIPPFSAFNAQIAETHLSYVVSLPYNRRNGEDYPKKSTGRIFFRIPRPQFATSADSTKAIPVEK